MTAFQVKRNPTLSGGRTYADAAAQTLWNEPLVVTGEVSIANGGTGGATLSDARANLGVNNVDNTSDAAKPVSTATQTALNAKAPLVHTHVIANTTGLQTALDAKSSITRTRNLQTGTTYDLALTDAGNVVGTNNAAANTIRVRTNANVAFPIGAQIDLGQFGVGQTAVIAEAGVTIRSASGKLKLTGQYSAASLLKLTTDEWLFFGDIAA